MPVALVTGGAGFIGSHIADALLEKGYKVHIIDDLSSGSRDNLASGAVLHVRDICDPSIAELLKEIGPDIVVHTAAQISVRKSMEDPVFDAKVNVEGLLNILHSLSKLPAMPYVVFTSTGGAIYGEQESFPAPETHPIRPTSIYGLSKRAGELYLDLWHREYGLRYAALRLANVYGPRQNPHGEAGVVAIFSMKLFAGETPTINGDGSQTRDFVFVGDVVNAVLGVCDKKITGVFNVGTGIETSVTTLYDQIAAAAGSPIKARRAEAKAGEQLRSSIDASLAGKSFGWKPKQSLKDGIVATVESFRTPQSTHS